jgi:hypothetical protein
VRAPGGRVDLSWEYPGGQQSGQKGGGGGLRELVSRSHRRLGAARLAGAAVSGLGIFGGTLAVNLVPSGHSVLTVDLDQQEVDRVAPELDSVVRADTTDEQVFRELSRGPDGGAAGSRRLSAQRAQRG